MAIVQAQGGQQVDLDGLKAFVKSRIGSVKTPKEIWVWDDLPRSKVGKALKVDLKKSFAGD